MQSTTKDTDLGLLVFKLDKITSSMLLKVCKFVCNEGFVKAEVHTDGEQFALTQED